MAKKTCNTCEWFVEEADTIGEYSHATAKSNGRGFCLIKDLFTVQEASDEACKEYQEEYKADELSD